MWVRLSRSVLSSLVTFRAELCVEATNESRPLPMIVKRAPLSCGNSGRGSVLTPSVALSHVTQQPCQNGALDFLQVLNREDVIDMAVLLLVVQRDSGRGE